MSPFIAFTFHFSLIKGKSWWTAFTFSHLFVKVVILRTVITLLLCLVPELRSLAAYTVSIFHMSRLTDTFKQGLIKSITYRTANALLFTFIPVIVNWTVCCLSFVCLIYLINLVLSVVCLIYLILSLVW